MHLKFITTHRKIYKAMVHDDNNTRLVQLDMKFS